MKTKMRIIMTAPNEEIFLRLKEQYMEELKQQNETDFLKYLERQYVQCILGSTITKSKTLNQKTAKSPN